MGPTRLTAPDQPLTYLVRFHPQAALETTTVGLVISKPSGGRWRFDLQLSAAEPDIPQRMVLEAAMGATVTAPVPLHAPGGEALPYKAWLSPETPLSFDFAPATGLLAPRGSPQQLTVSYTCKDFDKIMQGSLFVQTAANLYR